MRKPSTGRFRNGWIALTLALVLVAAACGDDDAAPVTAAPTAAPTAPPADECPGPGEIEGEIVFGGVGGSPEIAFLEVLIPRFESEFPGVTVTHVTGRPSAHFAQIEADPQGAGFDVVWSDAFSHPRDKIANLFEEALCVTNTADYYPQYLEPDNIGVQSSLAGVGLVYNPDALAAAGVAPPTSWADLWSEDFAGKVGLWAIPSSVGVATIFAISETLGSDEDAAFARLAGILDAGGTVFEAPAELEQLIDSQTVWVAPSSDARALQAINKGLPFVFVEPDEGMVPIPNHFDIPTGTQNIDAARAFLNFLARDDNLIHLVEGIFVSPVNAKIILTPELSAVLIDSAEEVARLMQPDYVELATNLEAWVERFNLEVIGG